MSQQTRIDQFYKMTSNKRTSNGVIKAKKNSSLKPTPYSRSRRKSNGKKQKMPLSQHSTQSDTDCTIVYEKVTCDVDIDDIQMLLEDHEEIESNKSSFHEDEYLEGPSNNMIDHKHELSPIIDTQSLTNTEVLNNDHICLETPMKELKSSSNINRDISENIESKETVKRELTESPSNGSPLSTVKSSASNNDNNFCINGTPHKNLKTPDKNDFRTGTFNSPTSSSKKSNYSPKVPSAKLMRNITPRKLFNHAIDDDDDIIRKAIEYMNLAKQNAILPNNFNLETIYLSDKFDYKYSPIDTKTAMKYEFNEITFLSDLKSKVLLTTIFTVLSNPVNCGYFDEHELDFIYSILTLPPKAQMLLSRMLSRKKTWHRKSNIKYETDIGSDLKDIFEILSARSICTFDIEKEDLSIILELLQADELKRLCQSMKINPNGKKEDNVTKLIKLSKAKSLFPGAKSPSRALYTCIFDILDYCVCITDTTWAIIDRILTLLVPNEDPQKSTADIFFALFDYFQGKKVFPDSNANRFPIFSCKLHLLNYVEAKSKLFTTLQFIDKKNWKKVQEYGNLAKDILSDRLNIESLSNSTLPMHVRRFMPGYMWLKILSKSIDAFKKNKDKTQAVEILKFLINQNCHMHAKKGTWYKELVIIEMHHHKNIEVCADIIMEALENEHLSQVDKIELIDRGTKILKKKTGVESATKARLNRLLDNHVYQMPTYQAATNIIDAPLMPRNTAGSKSIWRIGDNANSQSYGYVEHLALSHYCERERLDGLHCEGALPILLFVTLFWKELYEIPVRGAFVTPYQEAPGDLFTEQFYENRKAQIDRRFRKIRQFNSEELSNYMETRFKTYSEYQSMMPSKLLTSSQLKEICYCLGVEGVAGICQRLVDNFKLWKAGFPDLIVWNANAKQHKIVEVKGPKDTLSTKQRLWLEYLNQLGLNTEVCLVQDTNGSKRLRGTEDESDI